MMLSANECKNQGLQFAAVHDSYWTHPCDVDTMSSILRDAFVKLHKRSIMTDLKNEFEWRYIGYKLQETVVLTGQHLQQWNAHLKATGRSRGGSNLKQKKVVVWVDLKLPDLPARGDFDIEVIKSSKYFFH